MIAQTQITVRRKTSYADFLRAYKIEIDGVAVGSMRAGSSVTFPISPGPHALVLQIDWCCSKQVDFEAEDGEQISFECGSSLAGWRLLLAPFYVVFRTRKYLWLRRTACSVSELEAGEAA
jgi:hypothetical protein